MRIIFPLFVAPFFFLLKPITKVLKPINDVFKKILDIGDIIGVKGFVFRTQTGELSIHVKELTVLSKSLNPLPMPKEVDGKVYDAFTDPEHRYRKRYVDLIVNPPTCVFYPTFFNIYI